MAKILPVPEAPSYLSGALRERFDALAGDLAAAGILDGRSRDLLAKYVLAENEYLQVSNHVQTALRAPDADAAGKWLTAQDKLTKQILTLGNELGLTPTGRRSWGLPSR